MRARLVHVMLNEVKHLHGKAMNQRFSAASIATADASARARLSVTALFIVMLNGTPLAEFTLSEAKGFGQDPAE